ncbi:hypothetical protein WJX84_004766 [Apatococcus fuscideae]|uniref:Uncharacterized protein n=1 Tax=Apatococcus fuscideae TaxID=2026836 RepID=A0AAW1RVG3_9CHLO
MHISQVGAAANGGETFSRRITEEEQGGRPADMKQALLKHALVDLFQWARNTANMRTAGEGSEAHELDQAEPGPSDHDEHITLVADDGANYAFSELAAALHAHDFLHTALRLKLCDTCIAFKTVQVKCEDASLHLQTAQPADFVAAAAARAVEEEQ